MQKQKYPQVFKDKHTILKISNEHKRLELSDEAKTVQLNVSPDIYKRAKVGE